MNKEKQNIIVKELCDYLDKQQLNSNDLIAIISTFLYSIGSSLEEKKYTTLEEIITEYALHPRLGVSLMTQAIHMRDTWIIQTD